MGYCTKYELEINHLNELELIEELRAENEDAGYALDEEGDYAGDCKWYDHEDDIKDFSKKNPGVLFTLRGEGEESGDLWVRYFRNGLMQECRAEIVYPPFDENELE